MTHLSWASWARACKAGEVPPDWQEILDGNNNVGLYGGRRERHPDPPPGTCQWCGHRVGGRAFRRPDYVLPVRKYCSGRCSNDASIERRRQRRAAARQKVCEVCGEEFTAKRVDAKTCSPACKQKAYRRRRAT
jgi:predicted nucleic acid-binding Zn ribbon protein